MSVKPIDKQLMYQNSLHESKHRQNELNRPALTNQLVQDEETKRIEREKKRIQEGERSRGKKLERDLEQKKKQNSSKKKSSKKKGKGDRLDVLV